MNDPLHKFWAQRKDLVFKEYSTAFWRGYQGCWLLEDETLYIQDIKCSNYNFEQLFHSKMPVEADWFSGYLSIGIGKPRHDDFNEGYDEYLSVKIENGLVVEKKIITNFNLIPNITFGKYKGKNLNELILGKIGIDEDGTINRYIEGLIQRLSTVELDKTFLIPKFDVVESDNEILKIRKYYDLSYLLSKTFIAINAKLKVNNLENLEYILKFSSLVKKILNGDFNSFKGLNNGGINKEIVEDRSKFINPNINYLFWALANVDNFSVPPSILDKTIELKDLLSFDLKEIYNGIFEFKPFYKRYSIKFSDDIKAINLKKFEIHNMVKLNSETNLFEYDLSNEVIIQRYGFLLGEDIDDTYLDDESDDDYEENYSSYGKYSGSYAQDSEGLSDDFIDDVLGGDPDAYWNID